VYGGTQENASCFYLGERKMNDKVNKTIDMLKPFLKSFGWTVAAGFGFSTGANLFKAVNKRLGGNTDEKSKK